MSAFHGPLADLLWLAACGFVLLGAGFYFGRTYTDEFWKRRFRKLEEQLQAQQQQQVDTLAERVEAATKHYGGCANNKGEAQ